VLFTTCSAQVPGVDAVQVCFAVPLHMQRYLVTASSAYLCVRWVQQRITPHAC
jgi:hypothetical protein